MGSWRRRNLLSRRFDLVPVMPPQPLIGAAAANLPLLLLGTLSPRPPSLTPPLARVSPAAAVPALLG